MTKEMKRLSIVMLAMFLALFGSTTWIQAIDAQALSQHPENRRALYDSFEVQRGAIVASGSVIAESVRSSDVYSWQRQYNDPELWANVTGWMNPAIGRATGLEQAMNQELSGTASSQFFARIEQIISGQPQRGSNVMLSLDPAVQRAAYDALGNMQGAVVAIEPATGRILALVSKPSFDTNALAVHNVSEATDYYQSLEAMADRPMNDRAIAGDLNPPGSTFKLVVASAALAAGWQPSDEIDNPLTFTLPQSTSVVSNAGGGSCGGGEKVSLAAALALSCNVPMAILAIELGADAIRAEAEKYGFNASVEIPLIATMSQYPHTIVDDAQTALSGFGQGQVTATPLQMAMVSAGIANRGSLMLPHIVDQIIGPDLSVQHTTENTEMARVLDSAQARAMTTMMVTAVADGVAGNARIDGIDVAGKTGTAENGPNQPYTLWFTGFAPADNPQVAVAVVIEDGGGFGQSGSANALAAPIGKQVMEAVLGR